MLQNLRLLADPSRIRILLLVTREELSVAELQNILNMGQSRISTHLAQLKSAGLVTDRRSGKSVLYRLRPPPRPRIQVVHSIDGRSQHGRFRNSGGGA